MHCREDIRKSIIKEVINKYATKHVQSLGNNKLFLKNVDFGREKAYNVAESVIDRINKHYDEQVAHREQGSDGQVILIKPSKSLIDIYYNSYIDNYYRNNPDQTDKFGDSTPKAKQQGGKSFSAAALSSKGISKVKSFLERAGFDIEALTRDESKALARHMGGGKNDLVLGIVDTVQKIVGILAGKEDITLAEEGAHIMVEMLKQANHPLYKELFNKIGQYKIWDNVRQDPLYIKNPLYQKDGKPDIVALKEEAIGKLIAEIAALKEGSGSNIEDFTLPSETEDKRNFVYLIWNKILDFFRNAFKKPGFDPFEEATDILLGNKEFTPVDIEGDHKMLKIVTEEDLQNSTVDRINDIDKKITEKDGHFELNGQLVKHSIDPDKGRTEDDKLSETIELGRIDIKDIMQKLVDENGKLRLDKDGNFIAKPLVSGEKSALANYISPYNVLFNNIGATLKKFPEGTTFLYNKNIYDKKFDRATNVDLIAITPDGVANIITWEFLSEYSTKSKQVTKGQRERIQTYLSQVKHILYNNYDITKFGQSRGIPIIINMNNEKGKKSFKNLIMNQIKSAQNEALLPIPTVDEKTGNDAIDKHIKQLNALYKSINETPVVEGRRDVKISQLNAIFKAIQHLQINKNFTPLFQNVDTLLNNTKTLIKKHNEKFEGKTLSDFTNKEINEEAIMLQNLADGINLYKELDLQFKSYFESDKEANKEFIEKSKELATGVREQLEDIKNLIFNFASKYISEKRGIKDLTSAEPVVAGPTRLFRTLSQAQTQATKTYWLISEEVRNKTELDTLHLIEDLIQIEKDLQKTGLKTHEYQKLIEKYENGKRTNTLIDKYSHEFYTTLKKKIDEGDVKWIKANIDLEAFSKEVTEYQEKQLAQLEDMVFLGDVKQKAAQKRKFKSDLLRNTNLKDKYVYLNYLFVKQYPTDKWLSKEYLELKKNEPAFKLYEYIQNINRLAKKSGYLSAQQYRNFLPFMRKGFVEKMIFGGSYSAMDDLINTLSINDESVGFGSFNSLTGEIDDVIPKYFTSDIGKDVLDIDNNVYRDYSNVSDDIFKNMAIFTKQVIEYGHKKDIEGMANMLYFVEKNKQSLQVNQFGSLIKDALNFPTESNEANSRYFRNFLKNSLYGQRYITEASTDVLLGGLSEKSVEKWNKKVISINEKFNLHLPTIDKNSADKKMSLVKTIDAANRFVTLKVLGLNFASSLAQFFGGNFQGLISAGKYYTPKEFLRAEWAFTTHKLIADKEDIHLAMMKTFMPLGNEELQRKMNHMSLNKITAGSASEIIMYIMRTADSIVQYANFLAMMDNAVVINNQLVNVREYYHSTPEYQNRYNLSKEDRKEMEKNVDEKIKELKDKYGIDKFSTITDGKLKINASEESIHKYRSLVQQIGKKAAGNISANDESQIRMNIIGKSIMMFKNWIPNLVFQRTQDLTHIIGTDSYEWGRMRMVGGLLIREGWKSINTLKYMLLATNEGVEKMRELFKEKQKDYFEKHNKVLDMTEAEFFDLVRQNIKSQIRDTILFLSLLAMFYSFKALAPDDDEDEATKAAHSYFMRALDNITQEMTFYYNPMSLSNILGGSLFPALTIFTDAQKIALNSGKELLGLTLQDQEMIDSAHPIKYTMKAFPISKEALNYIAMFAPETADDLGIQIHSQAKQH